MKERVRDFNFKPDTLAMIIKANAIIKELRDAGYTLTLRQLYYQLVSRDIIPNKQSAYKQLGSILNDARLAGMTDWSAIEDRTRNLEHVSHWDSPSDIIESAASSFRIDKWATQENRVEVWVEKDALVGVLEKACRELDVAWFSCRGYTSQSELYVAGKRLAGYAKSGQRPVVIHLGDHDPSGIDMTRDITDRVSMLGRTDIEVRRIALNMDQVEQYEPPPNPAKITDSRFEGYQRIHGDESWELDALTPQVIDELITNEVASLRDADAWDAEVDKEDQFRADLTLATENWEDVSAYIRKNFGE